MATAARAIRAKLVFASPTAVFPAALAVTLAMVAVTPVAALMAKFATPIINVSIVVRVPTYAVMPNVVRCAVLRVVRIMALVAMVLFVIREFVLTMASANLLC